MYIFNKMGEFLVTEVCCTRQIDAGAVLRHDIPGLPSRHAEVLHEDRVM